MGQPSHRGELQGLTQPVAALERDVKSQQQINKHGLSFLLAPSYKRSASLSVKATVQKYTPVGKYKHHRVMNLCNNIRNWAQPLFEITQAFTSSANRIYFTWSWMFQYSLQARICELRFHLSS